MKTLPLVHLWYFRKVQGENREEINKADTRNRRAVLLTNTYV